MYTNMNKRGLLFATLTIAVIMVFVIGYSIDKAVKEKKVALDKIGISALATINSFYEGERIKYFIEKGAEYAVFNSLFLMGENGGIYDKTNCVKEESYVIWKGGCQPNNLDVVLMKYFNDAFNDYLENINLETDDFDINVYDELILTGNAKEKFEIAIRIGSKLQFKYDIEDLGTGEIEVTFENLGEYVEIVREYGEGYNVPGDLVLAVITQESKGDRYAVSKVGAGGVMQLMPETARGLGLAVPDYYCEVSGVYSTCDCIAAKKDTCDYINDERFDIERNSYTGIKFLRYLLDKYENIELALAAYNWGEGNVNKNCDLEIGFSSCRNVPKETQNYIKKVLKLYGLLVGGDIKEFRVKRIGTYYIEPEFYVEVDYYLEDYYEIKRAAEACLEDSSKCIGTRNYNLVKKNPIGNIMIFEFEARENLVGIRPVVIKFGLPIET